MQDHDRVHWLGELAGQHKDEIGFIVGNGWSTTYYNVPAFRGDGVLIGCNLGFERFPLDYLVWQDSRVESKCAKFKGIKLRNYMRKRALTLDKETTYFFSHGQIQAQRDNISSRIRLMHTGGMAMQIAFVLGCNPIILVGCDCCIQKHETLGMRSNVFEDKVMKNMSARDRKNFVKIGNRVTTAHLHHFAKTFMEVYERIKGVVDVYRMGDWSILSSIPSIDWPAYWSLEHPEVKDARKRR